MLITRTSKYTPRCCRNCWDQFVPTNGNARLCPPCRKTPTPAEPEEEDLTEDELFETIRRRPKAPSYRLGVLPRVGGYHAVTWTWPAQAVGA